MTEIERLKSRLSGCRKLHISWGPVAYKLTPEQKAAEINKALDEIGDATSSRMTFLPSGVRPLRMVEWLAEREV